MTDAPERIWARVCPDWHDGETGENFVGGQFDAGFYRDGPEYVRADLISGMIEAENAALRARVAELEAAREKDAAEFEQTNQMLQRATEEADELKAEVARLREAWLPIETAPTDGTEVLIGGGTEVDDQSTYYIKRQMKSVTIASYEDYGTCAHHWRGDNCGGHDEYYWHDPTHWRPLPDPPSARQEGE
jgi:hypothetical protein